MTQIVIVCPITGEVVATGMRKDNMPIGAICSAQEVFCPHCNGIHEFIPAEEECDFIEG